jgi:putative ABC transport system permease protein
LLNNLILAECLVHHFLTMKIIRENSIWQELILFVEAVKIAVESIRVNATRSALTIIGILVGVAVVVIVASLLQGAQQLIVNSAAGFAPDVLRIEKASFQDFGSDGQAFAEAVSKRPDFFVEDIEFLKNRLSETIEFGGQSDASLPVRRDDKTLTGIVLQGVTSNITQLSNVKVAYGRELNSTDNDYRRNVCVIGQDVVDELFGNFNPIGAEIRLGQLPYQVVGVAETRGSSFGSSQDGFVQIPLETFSVIFGKRTRSIAILAKARDSKKMSLDDVEEQIRVALRIRRGLIPDNKDDNFSFVTAKSIQAFSGSLTGIVGTIVYPLTAISLFVGGVVVMNMMLSSVTERTREIGIRMAVGARRRDVLTQFLIETTTLTLVGGIVGILFAAVLIRLIAAVSGLPLAVPIWALFLAIGVSCFVGIVFGVVPAGQAAKLDPIDALRSE